MAARLEVFENGAALAAAAASRFFRHVHDAVASHGVFRVALAGGGTPRAAYEQIAAGWGDGPDGPLAWERVHLFWGDERMVPHDDPRSNFGMARAALVSRVPIPAENVHPVPTDAANPASAAARYEETIRREFRCDATGFPRFDLIFLGMGADGHIASLFPGSPALDETERMAVAARNPEKDEPRVTLTLPVLNNAAAAIVLVSGGDKSAALKRALRGSGRPGGVPLLPAERLKPTTDTLLWLTDKDAAPWA